jgi:hypothetical protein
LIGPMLIIMIRYALKEAPTPFCTFSTNPHNQEVHPHQRSQRIFEN